MPLSARMAVARGFTTGSPWMKKEDGGNKKKVEKEIGDKKVEKEAGEKKVEKGEVKKVEEGAEKASAGPEKEADLGVLEGTYVTGDAAAKAQKLMRNGVVMLSPEDTAALEVVMKKMQGQTIFPIAWPTNTALELIKEKGFPKALLEVLEKQKEIGRASCRERVS